MLSVRRKLTQYITYSGTVYVKYFQCSMWCNINQTFWQTCCHVFHKRILSDKSFQSNCSSSVNIQYYLYCPKKFTFYLQCIQLKSVSGKSLSIMLANWFLKTILNACFSLLEFYTPLNIRLFLFEENVCVSTWFIRYTYKTWLLTCMLEYLLTFNNKCYIYKCQMTSYMKY